MHLATVHHMKGEIEKSVNLYNKALLSTDYCRMPAAKKADLHNNAALAFINIKNLEEAQHHLLMAVEINPNSQSVVRNLTALQLMQKQSVKK